jgi:predicted HicB family RNase H-like nuclease
MIAPHTMPAKPADQKSFQLFLPLDLHHRLKVRAAEEGTTITALIVEAIRKALDAPRPD